MHFLYILMLNSQIVYGSPTPTRTEGCIINSTLLELQEHRLLTIKNRILNAIGLAEPPTIAPAAIEQARQKAKYISDSSELLADMSLTVFTEKYYEIEYHPELREKLNCVDFPKRSIPPIENIQELQLVTFIENESDSPSEWDFILLMKKGQEVKNFDRRLISVGPSRRYELPLPKELISEFINRNSITVCFTRNGGNATINYHHSDYKKRMSLNILYSNGSAPAIEQAHENADEMNLAEFKVNLANIGWDFLLHPVTFNAGICVPKCGSEVCSEESSRSIVLTYVNSVGDLGKVRVPNLLIQRCHCI